MINYLTPFIQENQLCHAVIVELVITLLETVQI